MAPYSWYYIYNQCFVTCLPSFYLIRYIIFSAIKNRVLSNFFLLPWKRERAGLDGWHADRSWGPAGGPDVGGSDSGGRDWMGPELDGRTGSGGADWGVGVGTGWVARGSQLRLDGWHAETGWHADREMGATAPDPQTGWVKGLRMDNMQMNTRI